jgi:hypothetical protein
MFKLIRRFIGWAIIAAIVFLALALWQGGKPFRWFGRQSEEAGKIVREKSNEMAGEADKIKKKTDNVMDTRKKVAQGIRKAEDKIKSITESKDKE